MLFFMLSIVTGQAMEIVTIYHDPTSALTTNAAHITIDETGLSEAHSIAESLLATLKPRMPAAGLAAPQIGIKKRVIIFSWDRSIEHLQVSINPQYQPLTDDLVYGWEACFSSFSKDGPCKTTYLPRYKKIRAQYYDGEGIHQDLCMEGFAAKVLQHECDHLDGMVNVMHEHADTKEFAQYSEFITFLNSVKLADSTQYQKPIPYKE